MSCNTLKEELPSLYQDKTLISKEYLVSKGFEYKQHSYFLSYGDVLEIELTNLDEEVGLWKASVLYYDLGTTNSIEICTVGQLMLFLAIEDLFNLINELE